MNCKPGDLAVVIKTETKWRHLISKIYRVVDAVKIGGANYWLTDPPIYNPEGCRCAMADTNLRPLRDSDGQDETLAWKAVPKEVTQ